MSATGFLFTSAAMGRDRHGGGSPHQLARPDLRSAVRIRRVGHDARRSGLRRAIRVKNAAIVEELAQLGFTADTITLLELMPALHVAWAGGRMTRSKRRTMLEMASEMGVPDAAMACLETHLEFRADDAFFRRVESVLAQMCDLCPPAEAARCRRQLTQRIEKVRRGAGVLGLVRWLVSRTVRGAPSEPDEATPNGGEHGVRADAVWRGPEQPEMTLLEDLELFPLGPAPSTSKPSDTPGGMAPSAQTNALQEYDALDDEDFLFASAGARWPGAGAHGAGSH